MDPIDSGQGQETPSEQSWDLPPSSKGRQRKKNPRYLDYETNDASTEQNLEETPQRQSPGGERTAPLRTPRKRGRPRAAKKLIVGQENEATDQTPVESVGEIAVETPEKPVRVKRTPARKTPGKRTPGKRTAAKNPPNPGEDLPAGEGVVVGAVQQENGTPKPKRKYVRKQRVQEAEPAKDPGTPPAKPEEEEEEEIQPGGRRRRGAAKAALKYLHILATEVLSHPNDDPGSQPRANSEDAGSEKKSVKGGKGRRGRKRKHPDSDAAEDEDFVPDVEEEEEEVEELEDEDEGEAEDSDSDSDVKTCRRSPAVYQFKRNNTCSYGTPVNGLHVTIMRNVWEATDVTVKFREEHYSSWVFPEWVPSSCDWDPVAQSDLEKYLPQELHSAAFRVSRDGLRHEETPPERLGRFESVPSHPERWDMQLFAGGPVWALEWCPTPDGAAATQYVAVACHRGMDDHHQFNKTCTGPGLVQLWDVGKLEYNIRPDSQPSLAYGLAQDHGFIWLLKWCPAGSWERPSPARKAPLLPRLGLLAVATSNGVVTIYSLPHPEALLSNRKLPHSGTDSKYPPIYKAQGAVTLRLGSFKAPRHEKSGLVLSMDWLPEKPHNIMAIGFYDGVVGLWDLSTKSALLRVRESDELMSLLPYRCLLAHDHAVRALAFCPASRYLLATAGEDRFVKVWDLRRLDDPVTVQKRHMTTEIHWPLPAPGLMLAQENAYVAKGSQGLHYFDHHMRSHFAIPRTCTLWSTSYSEWLNCVVTADSLGEVILSLLPGFNYGFPYLKRTLDRRFPIYLTSLEPHDATEEENPEVGGVQKEEEEEEEEGDAAEDDAPEGGNENSNEGGSIRKDQFPPLRFRTYKEAVKKYCLHHTDNNMRTFKGSEKRPVWKRMKDTETKTQMNLDEMPLAALHKVRFNPNMSCHVWLVSAGQSGLVRLNCLRSLVSSHVTKMIGKTQARFNAPDSSEHQREAVHTETEQL